MFSISNSYGRFLVRALSTTPVKSHPPSLVKLKKIQADYQCEDGRPVWLKGGFCDRILFGTTIALCYLGVLMTFAVVYDNAKPESWKKSNTC